MPAIQEISHIKSPRGECPMYRSGSRHENVNHSGYFQQRHLIQEIDYTSIGRAQRPTQGWGRKQRSARAEPIMILRAGGTPSVKETRCQGCLAGAGATLKTSVKAVGEREKYPVFSLFLFCNPPLFLPLVDPDKRPLGKGDWELDREQKGRRWI